MAKIRKGIIGAFMCFAMLLIGVCALAACGSKDLTVTFSIEGKQQTVEVVDGKVNFPADPAKQYYEFRGWYSTDTFEEGTEFTKGTEIKESVTVYAYFVPVYIDISLNGGVAEEIKLENLSAKTAEYTADAESEKLTFDGWYVDSGYATQYTTQDVDGLYARYVANVVFDNGYETVYSEKVQENTCIAKPDADTVAKYYMDKEDIFYVDETGKDFDFSKPVTENTKISVLWKTPGLKYKINENTGKLLISDMDTGLVGYDKAKTFPVVSIPSRVTFEGKPNEVESVVGDFFQVFGGAYKVIFGNGIKSIRAFSGHLNANSVLEEIVLPDTLVILEDSLNNFSQISEIKLPETLEVIIDSLWGDYDTVLTISERGGVYSFDISIPASVKHMSLVPTNLTFSASSPFFIENGVVYKTENGKKVLVCNYAQQEEGRMVVPEGVEGIQAGAFCQMDLSYLTLPSTWSFVSYGVQPSDYPYYDGRSLYDPQYESDPTSGSMNPKAYAIFDGMVAVTTVAVMQREYPAKVSEYALLGNARPYTSVQFNGKTVFIGQAAEGEEVSVKINAVNTMSKESTSVEITKHSGDKLSRDDILQSVSLDPESLEYKIIISSIAQFGVEFDFGAPIDRNQYIDIQYVFDVLGFTYREENGELIVTGFDPESAQYLEDSNSYLVVIPEELNGKKISSIADGAFKNVQSVSAVYIANTVKTIGAEAFMNTSNLTEVHITPGGLEVIGRSAFENSGFTSIALPLANLKEIQPYAFKSRNLHHFEAVAGEEDRYLLSHARAMSGGEAVFEGLEEGMFFFVCNNDESVNHGIVKYVSSSVEQQPIYLGSKDTVDITVYDVQYVATAAGMPEGTESITRTLAFGYSYRKIVAFGVATQVMRYEIMEGSVYYLDNVSSTINLGIVSKIHKNAFTDMGTKFSEIKTAGNGVSYVSVKVYGVRPDASQVSSYKQYDCWMDLEAMQTMSDEIFEDGWWEGIMKNDPEYDEKMEFMQYIKYDESILGM